MALLKTLIQTTGTIALLSVGIFAGWQAHDLYSQKIEPIAQKAAVLTSLLGGK